MIIRGGENVYPIEIESVLADYPGVRRGRGRRCPRRPLGRDRAAPTWSSSTAPSIDEDDLRAFCRDRLAGYKVPVEFRVEREMPRNASGKILKRELRLIR